MKSRPILFSGAMVRALLENRKTQTRRVMKVQPPVGCDRLARVMSSTDRKCEDRLHWVKVDESGTGIVTSDERYFDCPYGVVGDRLYVRETFAFTTGIDNAPLGSVRFRADAGSEAWAADRLDRQTTRRSPWRPSIHMPRWASRITLEVTGVRVERLNAISPADAIAEGIAPISCSALWWNYLDKGRALTRPESSFRSLWESINGAGSWDANPWTWVVEFKAVQP